MFRPLLRLVGLGTTSVQNTILCSWLSGILWLCDVIWRWSFIPSTSKCDMHIWHPRYITPRNRLAKYQPKVRCAALKSWGLSLCARSPRVLGRSHGSFDLTLLFTVSTASTLLCPPILTKFSLALGRCIIIVLQILQAPHTQQNLW